MLHHDFEPVTVMGFDPDTLALFIRQSAGGMQISEITDKSQILYLHSYLSNAAHTQAKTIVVESHYVDRHYLEDFSEYYARCFNEYPRSCSRIHFFDSKFSHPDFLSNLASNNEDFMDGLKDSYLGFLVVRPIPHTFLGKLCLRPYKELSKQGSYKTIGINNSVSLFGIPLSVRSAPFVEKDEVVARCATSAIWALLSTYEGLETPSLSSITKSAGTTTEGGRTFPTETLTSAQITRSLRHFGLESITHHLDERDSIGDIKELSYAYISNDIPLLIGGTVYYYQDGVLGQKGAHLVCALGYRNLGDNRSSSKDLNLKSHSLDRLYVHDDRFGPYMSWSETEITLPNQEEPIPVWEYGIKGSDDSILDSHKEYFVPDIIICGTNHKIRIPYAEIFNCCNAFSAYIEEDMKLMVKGGLPESFDAIKSIQYALESTWAISLTSSTKLKEFVRKAENFRLFNGAIDKNSLLLKSLPKHLWLCRLENSYGLYMDILFDATEVPQGNIFLGFITYSEFADQMLLSTESFARERVWGSYNFDDESKIKIRPFVQFYEEIPDRQSLNIKYGSLRTPFRGLAHSERDDTKNITQRYTTTISAHNANVDLVSKVDEGQKYIWVIDILGNFIYGSENIDNQYGHPTLVDGRAARIGGELYYDKGDTKWVVNLFSAAYSSHIKQPSNLSIGYLDNVNKNFLNTLNATPDYGDPNYNSHRSE